MYPRVRTWKETPQVKLIGFAGYKAGMTHVNLIDSRPKSPTKGEEIRIPVTVLETPALRVLSVRLYSKAVGYGLSLISEAWSDQLTQDLSRRLELPKKRSDKLSDLGGKLEQAAEVRVLAYTQPKLAAFGKKKPDIFEVAIGGEDVKAQFEFAKSLLGAEIPISSVFNVGDILDVHAVTCGKGFQGVIKRFGIRRQSRKCGIRRKIGTMGGRAPSHVGWWVPQCGQMGFHTRTEYNKQLLRIANAKDASVTPDGGFVKYGEVRGDYALIAGSVPGPKKRLIRLTPAVRASKQGLAIADMAVCRRSQQ